MAQKFTKEASLQKQSPLFGKIPGELRNRIFELALTEYPGKQKPLQKYTHWCRPGFRYADRKIHTALLRTCQFAHGETHLVLRRIYVHVDWPYLDWPYPERFLEPYTTIRRHYYPWMTSLHLFATHNWLYTSRWEDYAEEMEKNGNNFRNVKITTRYSDWAYRGPPMLDPKRKGSEQRREAARDFHKKSWGRRLVCFKGLAKLELELETIELHREALDENVAWATGWRFPLHDEKVLVCKPEKTKKTGWYGTKLRKSNDPRKQYTHRTQLLDVLTLLIAEIYHEPDDLPSDPKAAKDRLVAHGVRWVTWDGEPDVLTHNSVTHYVVSLTYELETVSTSA